MTRECELCGRTLRTGRKYCYDCKTGGGIKRNKNRQRVQTNSMAIFVSIAIIVSSLLFIFISRDFTGIIMGIFLLFGGGVLLFAVIRNWWRSLILK